MTKPIYVTGHKNPDTDSIVSAIAYAAYKKYHGENAVAARLGSVSGETEYLLERFGFEDPHRIFTGKSSLHDIQIDEPATASPSLTMKEALERVLKLQNRGLIVVNENNELLGMVTLDDLTYMWTKTDSELEGIISTIEPDNMVKVLGGSYVLKGNLPFSGLMHMFPSLKSKVGEGSIVALRNEDDKLIYCIDNGAALLTVVTSSPISQEVISKAESKGVTIITTELSPLTVTRLIYQAPTIEQVMVPSEKIVYFTSDDTVDDAEKLISQSRYRSYPVLNRDGKVVGSISRYHLLTYVKKKFILVDHNEKKQTVDDIEDAEILEIVDHHRIGSFSSDVAIGIITEPVGATATIVADKLLSESLLTDKNLAGLLLGAIVADTMNFRSPTTTLKDRAIGRKLSELCGVSPDELSAGMIASSESILSKRFIEIVYDDFKEFGINGLKVGLAQSPCKSKDEFISIKDDLTKYMEDACKSGSYDLLTVMLTNPNGSGSYLLHAGPRAQSVSSLFSERMKGGFAEGVVSRKKQLLPELISKL